MKYRFLFLLVLIIMHSVGRMDSPLMAEENSLAYNLAVLHTKIQDPEKALMNTNIQPTRAVLAEFEYIVQTLTNRCLNPPNTIASTIVFAWQDIKRSGISMPLIDVARELTKTAKNVRLFGPHKVNFRMTTNYWLLKLKNSPN